VLASYGEIYRSRFLTLVKGNKTETFTFDMTRYNTTSSYAAILYKRASYEHDVINCSVNVFSKKQKKEFDQYIVQTNIQQRKCSVSVFKEYFKQKNRFFGDGVWYVQSSIFPKQLDGDFYPTGCNFDGNITKSMSKLSTCFQQHNISKILITGDSNGNRYREQLQYFICNRSKSCQLDGRGIQNYSNCFKPKEEWSEYFRVPNKPLVCSPPGCPHCLAQTYQVKGFGPDRLNMKLEFIGTIALINTKVRIELEEDTSNYILGTPTFLEFILRDYLPHHGFPDIWFISPPLHHEAWYETVEQFKDNMILFRRLLDHYLPSTTKIMLFTDLRECPMYRLDVVKLFHETFNTTRGRNEVFNAMNQVIFDTFRDRLVKHDSQYFGFLDIGRILCPFTCNWHDDGGHMRSFLHKRLWEYIFQYLCSDS